MLKEVWVWLFSIVISFSLSKVSPEIFCNSKPHFLLLKINVAIPEFILYSLSFSSKRAPTCSNKVIEEMYTVYGLTEDKCAK